MDNPRDIVEKTLVPHAAFEKARSRIEQCFRYGEGAAEPVCIALVGESRTGKSRALEECFDAHPPIRDSEGMNVPVLYVKTPSKPTVKGLAELMLRAMHDPRFGAGTENEKTIRLQVLMRNAGTRMVLIDEFQHFYDKASRKVMHHVADWLKILVDDCKVALVVAGLPTCRAVLAQNEQLAGRFLSPILMPRFDWKNEDHRGEFIGILGAFQETIGSHFDMPNLDSAEMAFRCYCGTGGLIGYLTKFLRQAVWNAIDNHQRSIALEDLALAHDEAVWSYAGFPDFTSPFNRNFVSSPSDALLTKVACIGIPKEEFVPSSRRVNRPAQPESPQQVFAAT